MKTNILMFLGISICLSTFLFCSPKNKKTETIGTIGQKDSLQFDFDTYLNKNNYEALDSGKSLIVVRPNVAFFVFRLKHLRVYTNFAGSDTTILDSLILVQFYKINDKWKKTSVRSYIVESYPSVYPPFQTQQMDFQSQVLPFQSQLLFYEDINGDGERDILVTIKGHQGEQSIDEHNEYKLCYLQHTDRQSFVYVRGFEELGNPVYDAKTKKLFVKEIYSRQRKEETYTWQGDSLVFQKGHQWTNSKYGERNEDYTTKKKDYIIENVPGFVEKFEQNGLKCVYINPKAKYNNTNYLTIILPNEPDKIIKFEPDDSIRFHDRNKDGFKDIVCLDESNYEMVYLFDKENNDFTLIPGTEKPILPVDYTDTLNLSYIGTCETKARVIEKFEQNRVLCERMAFYAKGAEFPYEWLNITAPDLPCQVIDLTSFGSGIYLLKDWDKDGYKDIIQFFTEYPSYNVTRFDSQWNEFVKINHTFSNQEWVFDASKGLKIEYFGEYTPRNKDGNGSANYRFQLYQYKNNNAKTVAKIKFGVDEGVCSVTIKKGESDEPGEPLNDALFDDIKRKAEKIHANRDKYERKRREENVYGLSDAQQDALYKKYEPFMQKAEADHKVWIEEAKLVVEVYFRQN